MKHSAHPVLSGTRFTVTYTLTGNKRQALDKAHDICYEQTVEFPPDLVPESLINNGIVGRIEDFGRSGRGSYRADISFSAETVGAASGGIELTQLLNVIFGNISLKPGIKVESLALPSDMLRLFQGPRFGAAGLRRLVGTADRPLICTALKPMGLPPLELARQAYLFALGGIDIIKDDHGLADQPFCPFGERVARCAEAVHKANGETGRSAVYMPNITVPADNLTQRVRSAVERGAGALLVIPGITGIDTIRLVAEDESCDLPVVSHPAFWGSFTVNPYSGLSHYVLYGQLMRLAGADAVVFPHHGGRFAFSREDCLNIARGCSADMGHLKKCLPAPGGGVTKDKLRDMIDLYGRDFILLIGGELHRGEKDLAENSRRFVEMLENGVS
jgi:ribulose-bisphosphate carboxylase large chain